MRLPDGENHRTREWVLKDKKVIEGVGINGKHTKVYKAIFECRNCRLNYTRFVSKLRFELLVVGVSTWEWGWIRNIPGEFKK